MLCYLNKNMEKHKHQLELIFAGRTTFNNTSSENREAIF